MSEGRVSEGRTFNQSDFDTEHFFKSVVHTVRNIFRWQIKRYHKLCFRCNTPVKMKPLWPTEQHQKMKRFKRMKPNKHQDVSTAMLVNTLVCQIYSVRLIFTFVIQVSFKNQSSISAFSSPRFCCDVETRSHLEPQILL